MKGLFFWYFSDNKCHFATVRILKKAKSYPQAFDIKLAVSGKMNFLAYCFRTKNNYGMTDKTEHVLTPNTKSECDHSAEDIKNRYLSYSAALTHTRLFGRFCVYGSNLRNFAPCGVFECSIGIFFFLGYKQNRVEVIPLLGALLYTRTILLYKIWCSD